MSIWSVYLCVVPGRKYGTPVSGWHQQLVSHNWRFGPHRSGGSSGTHRRTEEMMHPRLIYLHAISLFSFRTGLSWSGRRPATGPGRPSAQAARCSRSWSCVGSGVRSADGRREESGAASTVEGRRKTANGGERQTFCLSWDVGAACCCDMVRVSKVQ